MKKITYTIIIVAIFIGGFLFFKNKNVRINEIDSAIKKETIRLGYIIYPPLLEKDLNTGELSGVSYDIVNAIAKKMDKKIEWVEEVGWGTALEGLKTKRYQILGTQMWPNKERLTIADFSVAPMKSVLYPYVRSDDIRFDNDLNIINDPHISVSAIDGEMAVFIAKEDYPKATLNALPQLSSYAEVYLNIIRNKADITFTEPSAANNFLNSNPGTIKKINVDPVRSFGNSFAFYKDDVLIEEWNNAINELILDGTINSILKKHGVENDYLI